MSVSLPGSRAHGDDPGLVRTRRLFALALGGAVAVSSLAACEPLAEAPPIPHSSADVSAAAAQLDTLIVGTWASMSGYSRDRFGKWGSQGDSCNTRDVVLQRDGQGVVTTTDCKITQGTWFSVYDGKTVTDPQDIDIDHMVPLANAWRTGAATWTDQQRAAFANDLDRPQLIAVTTTSNRSKGDQDPSEWTPPRREYWCTYAQSWTTVKAYWKLSVTAAEKAALVEMLGRCA
jgi:Protein of unknown function (DUF1524)